MDNILPVRARDDLLALLRDEQDKSGYIDEQFIEQTAQTMGLSKGDVYGVATFYHFLSTRPLGRNVIRVCKSIPCYLKRSQLVVETIQAELGIAPGETTSDGLFTLQLTNCIGACDQAPAMLLNHELHGNLTPAKISQILNACSLRE
jgi:NADH:ubiquinone oxidoreductase subunit E